MNFHEVKLKLSHLVRYTTVDIPSNQFTHLAAIDFQSTMNDLSRSYECKVMTKQTRIQLKELPFTCRSMNDLHGVQIVGYFMVYIVCSLPRSGSPRKHYGS